MYSLGNSAIRGISKFPKLTSLALCVLVKFENQLGIISDIIFSFRRELSVMHSLRMCCKILCQNLRVHPNACWVAAPNSMPMTFVLHMGIWDFSKFGLSIKSWKLVSTDPPSPLQPWTWEFGILVGLLVDRILRKLIFDPRRSIFSLDQCGVDEYKFLFKFL